ncbi:hypothetical protein SH2C18_41730 [Clostridium sediminicola]|uniref:hypothetical protein n=1 Tax=Clostridium sediminicola TaxID=3114879 RepID=UPI0031F216D3
MIIINKKPKEKIFNWLIIVAAIFVPGSGHVFLGKPVRGLFLIFWMFIFGYITFQLTTPEISFIGRLSGGFAIWTISVLEVYRIVRFFK